MDGFSYTSVLTQIFLSYKTRFRLILAFSFTHVISSASTVPLIAYPPISSPLLYSPPLPLLSPPLSSPPFPPFPTG